MTNLIEDDFVQSEKARMVELIRSQRNAVYNPARIGELCRLLQCYGGADLDLSYLNFTYGDLTGADLHGATMIGCIFDRTFLSGADLRGVVGLSYVSEVPNIDREILKRATETPQRFDMLHYYLTADCGTVMCRAGWAVELAGLREMADRIGYNTVGALIYAKSRPNKPVPDFYVSTEEALADLRTCAEDA